MATLAASSDWTLHLARDEAFGLGMHPDRGFAGADFGQRLPRHRRALGSSCRADHDFYRLAHRHAGIARDAMRTAAAAPVRAVAVRRRRTEVPGAVVLSARALAPVIDRGQAAS